MRRHWTALPLAFWLAGNTCAMTPDIETLWDFSQPQVSEERFRAALASASGDGALILR
jgi:hypothetical protein